MGYMKVQSRYFVGHIANYILPLLALLLLLPKGVLRASEAHRGEVKGFLPQLGCFQVDFTQRGVFWNETENYNGTLTKLGNRRWEIVYYTNPPFVVSAEGDYVVLGYVGEKKERLDLREYPNPVLEVLLHLDRPWEIFSVKALGGNRYLLTPKGELGQYVRKAILETDGAGFVKRLEVYGGRDNYLVFEVLRIKPSCGGNKIGKP